MTDFPDLKLKALVSFPAAVFGGAGIAVTKVNGQFYFDLDFSHYPVVASIPALDLPNTNVLTYNLVSKAYVVAPYGAGGIADAPSDGTLYGRKNAAWAVVLPTREMLTAPRTYYVSATGSDSNNGLTPATPFLTIGKAYTVLCGTIDTAGFNVTISVADGTYPSGLIGSANWVGGGQLFIQGNIATPSNVLINIVGTPPVGYGAFDFFSPLPNSLTISGMKIVCPLTSALRLDCAGSLFFGNMEFGAVQQVVAAVGSGASIQQSAPIKLLGSASGACFYSQTKAQVMTRGNKITIGNNPVFGFFAYMSGMSDYSANVETFDGIQTVTISIASSGNPGIISWPAHGLIANSVVVLNTSGALPSHYTAGASYFVVAAGLTAGSFALSATSGGAAISTFGDTQSGTHNAFSCSGQRYYGDLGSTLNTGTNNQTYLPGSTPGQLFTGAQYV